MKTEDSATSVGKQRAGERPEAFGLETQEREAAWRRGEQRAKQRAAGMEEERHPSLSRWLAPTPHRSSWGMGRWEGVGHGIGRAESSMGRLRGSWASLLAPSSIARQTGREKGRHCETDGVLPTGNDVCAIDLPEDPIVADEATNGRIFSQR